MLVEPKDMVLFNIGDGSDTATLSGQTEKGYKLVKQLLEQYPEQVHELNELNDKKFIMVTLPSSFIKIVPPDIEEKNNGN